MGKDIPDKSVDMVLTSPPYDNLRDYKGYIFNFEEIAKEYIDIINKRLRQGILI
jgi:DNA modification methylase